MEAGTLLYIKNYMFDNGQRKDKFFLILKRVGDSDALLISLPSSKDYVPSTQSNCVEISSANQTAFIFNAREIITNTNFSFSVRTYLYGQYITVKSVDDFNNDYPQEGRDYEKIGKLKYRILQQVIDCFKQSATVKNKIKKIL